jgi:hypothetical protein
MCYTMYINWIFLNLFIIYRILNETLKMSLFKRFLFLGFVSYHCWFNYKQLHFLL